MTVEALGPSGMADDRPAWGAVYATGLGVAGLTAAEMLPVSLLTPMATGLSVTEGTAGQAITATAVTAFLSSLLIAVATRRLDRRGILLSLTAMQVVSNLIVALAPGLPTLLVGRMMLGISLGGFWALSASVAMRLVPETYVPKAFSVIFGGVSVATVAAAPVGSYLGSLIGWRGVFLVAAALSAVGLVWQSLSLPSMPPRGQTRLATLFHVLRRPRVGVGMLGMGLVFAGHFAFFTYLRPFLEAVTQAGESGVSIILLAFGISSFLGTTASGWLIGRSLRLTLALVPMLMCVAAVSAVILGRSVTAVTILVTLWGLSFGMIPVGWSTWLTRTVPDEAESGGGLLVAAIQVAMTFGAAVGGIVVDRDGVSAVFGLSAAVLLAAAAVVVAALRTPTPPPTTT